MLASSPTPASGPAVLAAQLADLERALAEPAPPPPSSQPPGAGRPADLPRVYGWLVTPSGRRRVKCLLDSGATHCFIRPSLAAQLGADWSPSPRGGPASVRQADGALRATQGSVDARLQLGALDETTRFIVFGVDCDADLILGYSWLRAHGLAFLYESDQVCICAEAGCSSGLTVRLDLVRPSSAPVTSAFVLRGPALHRLIREVPMLPRP